MEKLRCLVSTHLCDFAPLRVAERTITQGTQNSGFGVLDVQSSIDVVRESVAKAVVGLPRKAAVPSVAMSAASFEQLGASPAGMR